MKHLWIIQLVCWVWALFPLGYVIADTIWGMMQ